MTTTDLQQLLADKSWRAEFEVSDTGLRIFLQDPDSGDCGVLAVEPVQLALPDERALDYSWQDVRAELGPPEYLYDIATRVEPDFPKGSVPFLFD